MWLRVSEVFTQHGMKDRAGQDKAGQVRTVYDVVARKQKEREILEKTKV